MTSFFPIFPGSFPEGFQFLPALLVGFAFGFVLERSGFGRADVLAAQFYGNNMRVFKVMFGAIITAAVGMALLISFGLLNMKALYIPSTFLWPHLFGGLLLGVGFIVSGYCPGTSIVAAASGKWDGAVAFLGVIIGSVFFGEFFSLLKPFYLSGAKGVMTFPDLTGIPYQWLVFGVVLMAITFFVLAEKGEAVFSRMRNIAAPQRMTAGAKTLLGSLALTAALTGLFVTLPMFNTSQSANKAVKKAQPIQAVALAERLIQHPRSTVVLDLRSKDKCKGKARIPRAICFYQVRKDMDAMYPKHTVVLFDTGTPKVIPKEAFNFRGEVRYLKGGHAAWKATVLKPLSAKEQAKLPPQVRKKRLAMTSYFTNTKQRVTAKPVRIKVIRRKGKKSGGCL